MTLDFGKKFLFQRQIFEDCLDYVIGVAHRAGQIGARVHARNGTFVFAEVTEVGGDA